MISYYNKYTNNTESLNSKGDFYSEILSSGAMKAFIFNAKNSAEFLFIIEQGHLDFPDEYSKFTYTSSTSSTEYSSSHALKENNSSNILIRSVSEQIAFIRSYLSLNISEASRIFGVQRPSIYAWISGESSPSDANQKRINLLYDLALNWKNKNNSPIGELRRLPLASNKSITDLLLQEDIDKDSILALFSDLYIQKDNLSDVQQSHYSIRQIAKEHGFEERSCDEKRRSFLLASSKK